MYICVSRPRWDNIFCDGKENVKFYQCTNDTCSALYIIVYCPVLYLNSTTSINERLYKPFRAILYWQGWVPWWRHQMETFSALLAICAGNLPSNSTSKLRFTGLYKGNSPVTGEFPHKGPVTWKLFPFQTSSWLTYFVLVKLSTKVLSFMGNILSTPDTIASVLFILENQG